MRSGYCDSCGRKVFTGKGKVDRSNPHPKPSGLVCRPCFSDGKRAIRSRKEMTSGVIDLTQEITKKRLNRSKMMVYGFAASVAVALVFAVLS